MGDDTRLRRSTRDRFEKFDDWLLWLSVSQLRALNNADENQSQTPEQPDPEFEQATSDALGFKEVKDYRAWKKETADNHWTAEQAADHLDYSHVDSRALEAFNEGTIAHDISTGLLSVIGKHESGNNYDKVFGGNTTVQYTDPTTHVTQTRHITDMTINEVLYWQHTHHAKSDAAGRYQIIEKTLGGLKDSMHLTGNEKFDADMQDKMVIKLLDQRGYQKFLNGQMSEADFMKSISQEWASLPEDWSGKSYYAGDGLNKAGVSPAILMAAIRHAKDLHQTGADAAVSAAGGTTPAAPATKLDAAKGQGPAAFASAVSGTTAPKPEAAKPAAEGGSYKAAFANAVTTTSTVIAQASTAMGDLTKKGFDFIKGLG